MKTSENELIDLIAKLVQEKTFSMEGVKAIESLRVSIDETRLELERCIRDRDMYRTQRDECKVCISALEKQLDILRQKEKAIEDREKNMHIIDVRVAVAEARQGTMYDMIQMLFRNTIVRESLQKTVVSETPAPYMGGIPTVNMRQGDSEIKTTQTE